MSRETARSCPRSHAARWTARDQRSRCKANGNGKRVPLDIKAGNRILFGKYLGQEIKLDGQEYFIMKEDDVLAVIEGGQKKKKKK